VNQEATKVIARAKRIAGALGVPSRSTLGEGHADIVALELSMIGFPGVVEDGMPGWNEQRKPGTTRGSPRRSRTAKASRISRHAVKSRCAHEWDGWGRVSDDGPGHYNPYPSEGPWGGGVMILHGGAQSSLRPDTVRDNRWDYEAHEGRMQTGCLTAYAGSGLKPLTIREGTAWKASLPAVLGKTRRTE
jgi:hypothetical protein